MTDTEKQISTQCNPLQSKLLCRIAALEAEVATLRQAEIKYRNLFTHSCLGILLADYEGNILDANPCLLSMLGYSFTELLSYKVDQLQHPHDAVATSYNESVTNALLGKATFIERRFRKHNGSFFHVLVNYKLFDVENKIFQIILQDISSQKTAEIAKNAALDKARAACQVKSAFLANMSHEIRTPLNGIMGMIQLALTAAPTEEQRDYLTTALASSEALLCVLSDVLDVSRLDSGRMVLDDKDFTLDAVIRPMADAFTHEAKLKGLSFSSRIDPSAPVNLRGDPVRLRQILYNLIANAIKYTVSGNIFLEVLPASHPGPAQNDRTLLDFLVSDTGIGIPAAKQECIFDAFSQADPSLTRPYGGTGLGLTIVKGLTDLMAGQVHICSEEGKGTVVRLRLGFPLARTAGRIRDTRPLPRLAGVRVLVVEDEQINQLTMRAMLQKFGCQPRLAANGREALDLLGREDFDCVLMDMQMPVMDGLEATRRIRAGAEGVRNPNMPIIALTAHALDDDRTTIMAAGVSEYITKPVDMHVLIRAIGRSLGIIASK
jgi:two-component system sensor histidine kinase EvgS